MLITPNTPAVSFNYGSKEENIEERHAEFLFSRSKKTNSIVFGLKSLTLRSNATAECPIVCIDAKLLC